MVTRTWHSCRKQEVRPATWSTWSKTRTGFSGTGTCTTAGRWSRKLSDQLTVTQYRQVAPISDLGADAIGVSGIGTIAAARVIPHESEEEAFVAVSMYARG